MKFAIEDREYEFDGEYTVAEAMLFFDKAQVGIAELQGALQRGNPYAVATMMYVLKRRAGEAVNWQDMQALPVSALRYIPPSVDELNQLVNGDEPASKGESLDPTEVAGSTPQPDTGTTS